MTTVLGIITGLGAIIGGLVYMAKAGLWILRKTPEQKAQKILTDEEQAEREFEQTGRPQ